MASRSALLVQYHADNEKYYAYPDNDSAETEIEIKFQKSDGVYYGLFDGMYAPVYFNANAHWLAIGQTIWKVDSSGIKQWQFNATQRPAYNVKIDGNDNVFVGGRFHDDYFNAGYFNSSHDLVFYKGGMMIYVFDIAFDANYLYVAGARTYGYSVAKIRISDGQIIWTFDTGNSAYGITVDGGGNVYVACYRYNSKSIYKLDSAGNESYSYDTNSHMRKITLDSSGNVIVVGDTNGSANCFKLTSSLSLVASNLIGYYARAVDIDSSGNIYIASSSSGYKCDSSFSIIWTYPISNANGIAVDSSGNVCLVGTQSANINRVAWYLNSSGALQWYWEPTTYLPSVYTMGLGIDFDSNDNIYIAGRLEYTFT